ncbi:cytochrome c biogenesis CcdA family protein [Kibdelosporangium persicum]|uniref:Cytochrome c biogenesis protein transmembrane region n=1 Tax=Kibdelosporangium persicum TaxID=2698649 RepID=A0ABX2F992_9PSEU|nr:cytochrome c biogenesis CcdA family protein [Kibdelosporangium persicum]NRN67931.1 Cytochrome c biogenesis protein transmembrane region [Kibdelosporangium persicum]
MDFDALGFALAAGMVAVVNPCGFAMLPAYLTLVVAGESRAPVPAVLRALAATGLMALGFLVVFGAFGLVVAPLGSSVQEYLPAVTVVIGAVMVALGAWMLAGKEVTLLLPKPRAGAPTARLSSMFGYGLAYAVVSLSCTIAPFLAVTSTTFRSGSVLTGIAAYVAYGLGMSLVVGVLAVSIAVASKAVTTWVRRIQPYIGRIGGVILVLAGLYIAYYGVYELRLFHADGPAEDPIVDAAGALQTALSTLVDRIGPVPLVTGLVVLIGAVALITRRRARVSSREDEDTSA